MLDADGHAFGCAANPSTHTAVRSAVGSVRSRTERRAAARPSPRIASTAAVMRLCSSSCSRADSKAPTELAACRCASPAAFCSEAANSRRRTDWRRSSVTRRRAPDAAVSASDA